MSSGGGGFFGLFNYSKPGKGVRKDEPQRSRFVQFWVIVKRKFWKLIQLNLLYILFCLPVVTIGPATAAMTYILRLYVNEQPVFLVSDFWDAFKANWKQAFVHSVMVAAITYIIITAVRFYNLNAPQHKYMYVLLGLSVMVALIAFMANFYMSLMIVTLDLRMRHIIKNAFILAILGIKRNLLTILALVLFLVAMFLVTYFFLPVALLIVLALGFSFTRLIIVFNAWPAIDTYAIQPFIEKEEKERDELGVAVEEEAPDSIFTDEYDLSEEDEDEEHSKEKKEEKRQEQIADDFLGRG